MAASTVNSTAEVLLLQYLRRYGFAAYDKILPNLQRNPLLQQEPPEWSEELCLQVIKEVELREKIELSTNIDQAFRRLHAERIASLKSTILADEVRYKELKRTIEEEEQAKTASEEIQAKDNMIDRTVSDSDAKIAEDADVTMREASQDQSDVKSIAKIETSPIVVTRRSSRTDKNKEAEADHSLPVSVQDSAAIAATVKEEQKAPRKRGRSNTVNTTASVDSLPLGSSEPAESAPKRKVGRPPRKPKLLPEASTESSKPRAKSPTPQSEQNTKGKFQSTIGPVLSNLSADKNAAIFANAVSDRDAPSYSKAIRSPTDLKQIKAQIKSGLISDVAGFQNAVLRMLANAVMFNTERSEISKMTRELHVTFEALIALYKSAEIEAPEEDEPTPKRRRRA